MVLGHPEADVRTDLREFLLDVRDVRYSPERAALMLLPFPDDAGQRLFDWRQSKYPSPEVEA